jgi:hypothetical protein
LDCNLDVGYQVGHRDVEKIDVVSTLREVSFQQAPVAKLHGRLWLNGFSPLLYVGWQTRVDVLSCARGPDFWKDSKVEYGPAERIEIAKQISFALGDDDKLSRFSAFRLSDGTFWDDPANSSLAQSEKAAHRQLIRAVVETDDEIKGHEHPVLRRLLLLTVLIKYLEDRGVFPKDWFNKFQSGRRPSSICCGMVPQTQFERS